MKRLVMCAYAIARRDYIAAVRSRTFVIFLLCPVLVTGVIFLLSGAASEPVRAPRNILALALTPEDARKLVEARLQLSNRLGAVYASSLELAQVPGEAPPAGLFLTNPTLTGILSGNLGAPVLTVTNPASPELLAKIALLLDTANAVPDRQPRIEQRRLTLPKTGPRIASTGFAHTAQIAMFFFILLLSGMLLSNFIEEKSSKILDVMVSAVPIESIFMGKLLGMLAISISAILIWAGMGTISVQLLLPNLLANISTPAVGWPLFCALWIIYFTTTYLLVGAIFLGIGSRAATPRDVQMLSLPVTIAQVLLLSLASIGVDHPASHAAHIAKILPWSSPLAMIGQGATSTNLPSHAVAILWQLSWLILAVILASRRFKSEVLQSGAR